MQRTKVHFLTAYLEYLLDQGIRSEYYYFGDASRFLRFLLARTETADIEAFINRSCSPAYQQRLRKTLKKFYAYAEDELGIGANPLR